jgi:hypothetical protein
MSGGIPPIPTPPDDELRDAYRSVAMPALALPSLRGGLQLSAGRLLNVIFGAAPLK